MRSLSFQDVLAAWDAGSRQHPARRAVTLLAAASPDVARDQLERLSIGERDSRLLTLYESTFGGELVGLASCPSCREVMELAFETRDIRAAPVAEVPEHLAIETGGGIVHFRLPDSRDLTVVAGSDDVETISRALLQRCLVAGDGASDPPAVESLSAAAIEAIAARMTEVDPQANVDLDLACPACGEVCPVVFDIAAYLWSHVETSAKRTLREVHQLASAYGWAEHDVLAMSPARRQTYLSMVAE